MQLSKIGNPGFEVFPSALCQGVDFAGRPTPLFEAGGDHAVLFEISEMAVEYSRLGNVIEIRSFFQHFDKLVSVTGGFIQ